MVPFAGFLMPVQYTSITEEHRAVRERAGIFDVSHMGEFIFGGPDALEAVQRVTVNDVSALSVDQAQYSAMVNEDGGIIDDCVVYRLDDARRRVRKHLAACRTGSRGESRHGRGNRCSTRGARVLLET